MLTFIFLFGIAVLIVAGIFIAMQAKRRSGTEKTNAPPVRDDTPKMGRATPDND